MSRLECPRCSTAVEGEFVLPLLSRLSTDDQALLLSFLKSSGSLKDLARLYKVSYPTMRNRLDALIHRVGEMETAAANAQEV